MGLLLPLLSSVLGHDSDRDCPSFATSQREFGVSLAPKASDCHGQHALLRTRSCQMRFISDSSISVFPGHAKTIQSISILVVAGPLA